MHKLIVIDSCNTCPYWRHLGYGKHSCTKGCFSQFNTSTYLNDIPDDCPLTTVSVDEDGNIQCPNCKELAKESFIMYCGNCRTDFELGS